MFWKSQRKKREDIQKNANYLNEVVDEIIGKVKYNQIRSV